MKWGPGRRTQLQVRLSVGLGATGTPCGERLKTSGNHFVQKFNAPSQPRAIARLLLFREATVGGKLSKRLDILSEKNRIVKKLLVAFVAEDRGLTFDAPGTGVEDRLSLSSRSIL